MAKITAVMLALMSALLLKDASARTLKGNFANILTAAKNLGNNAVYANSNQNAQEENCEKSALKTIVVKNHAQDAEMEKAESCARCDAQKLHNIRMVVRQSDQEHLERAEKDCGCKDQKIQQIATDFKTQDQDCGAKKNIVVSGENMVNSNCNDQNSQATTQQIAIPAINTQQIAVQADQRAEDQKNLIVGGCEKAESSCQDKQAAATESKIQIPVIQTQNIASQGCQVADCQANQQQSQAEDQKNLIVGGCEKAESSCQDKQAAATESKIQIPVIQTQNIASQGCQVADCQANQQQSQADQQQNQAAQNIDVSAIHNLGSQCASADACDDKKTLNIGALAAAGHSQDLGKQYVAQSGSLLGGIMGQAAKSDCAEKQGVLRGVITKDC